MHLTSNESGSPARGLGEILGERERKLKNKKLQGGGTLEAHRERGKSISAHHNSSTKDKVKSKIEQQSPLHCQCSAPKWPKQKASSPICEAQNIGHSSLIA